jgi:hypothetical protein
MKSWILLVLGVVLLGLCVGQRITAQSVDPMEGFVRSFPGGFYQWEDEGNNLWV